MDPLSAAMKTAASGLEVQSTRLRVVSENMANAQATATEPGGDPYQRKTVSFVSELDALTGASMVRVESVGRDTAAFTVEYDPSHSAADENGMVKLPNVNILIEMADMREANRSYEANLQTIKQSRKLISMTIDLLRVST
ncbi:flagellar basal body rod protein FlgC [Hoeflea prorocentri]|uniref:Flagellar basal-body rod protein FlgC n=1 Tax=Hoeflea prorocentri TaxID=1922333 RepID=A0A9X3UJ99_9HYPH|nr:flagellar basal body rod protein FlgC [Hoeflea prorocentri]MCY6382398.1 flagellar basal body rod protein FlgC [Hoeflea prorocentri]MDA5400198.1 flagellar basal body rod protein FlgC [Hoeflea prorocentri]